MENNVVYYGVERNDELYGAGWVACGVIGVVDKATYADVRSWLAPFEHLRVVMIDNKSIWQELIKERRLIEFNTLCSAINILCIK